MKANVSCPLCNKESASSPIKTWQFGKYTVNRYECSSCKSKFNIYKSPQKTYTIPKSKKKM